MSSYICVFDFGPRRYTSFFSLENTSTWMDLHNLMSRMRNMSFCLHIKVTDCSQTRILAWGHHVPHCSVQDVCMFFKSKLLKCLPCSKSQPCTPCLLFTPVDFSDFFGATRGLLSWTFVPDATDCWANKKTKWVLWSWSFNISHELISWCVKKLQFYHSAWQG